MRPLPSFVGIRTNGAFGGCFGGGLSLRATMLLLVDAALMGVRLCHNDPHFFLTGRAHERVRHSR